MPDPLRTSRLTLFAATIELLRMELESPAKLGDALCAQVPGDWPPGEYDRDAMEYFVQQLTQRGAAVAGWLGWYAVAHATETRPAALIGCGGYMGPPGADGMVEIGYSVSSHWRGHGFATEMVAALLQRAREQRVRRVIAHTRSENPSSIAVLERNGFQQVPSTDTHLEFEFYPERDAE